MVNKFSIGQKVRLIRCNQEDLEGFGSSGIIGETYTIVSTEEDNGDGMLYELEGENWHKDRWLVPLGDFKLGGNLL